MQAAGSSLQVFVIEPSSLKRIEAGGVVQISWSAHPQFQEDEIFRPQHLQPDAQNFADNGPSEGALRWGVPCPQPVNLDAIHQHAQPRRTCITPNLKEPSPSRLEGLSEFVELPRRKQEHKVHILCRARQSPGLESRPTGEGGMGP